MGLTLQNMLDRVKRRVPTTTHDTELQDALLERMNYLVSLDMFPFQEVYQTATLSTYYVATPPNFGVIQSAVLWLTDGRQKELEILDSTSFSKMFPEPEAMTNRVPTYGCIKVAEGQFWVDCIPDSTYNLRMLFYAIPDDVTDPTVSQLTELAKLCLIDWASADGFRLLGQHDTAGEWKKEGDDKFRAMERRYQRAIERDGRFLAPNFQFAVRRRQLPDYWSTP